MKSNVTTKYTKGIKTVSGFGSTHTVAEELVTVLETPDNIWALGLTTDS